MNKQIKRSFIRQQGQSDCGVACLAMVIRYHGGDAPLERLRELSGTHLQGTTILGLYQAGSSLGFDCEGLEADGVENLRELKNPAILHVIVNNVLQHYFVFYGFDEKGNAIIGDPAEGLKRMPKDILASLWQSKAVLAMTPNNHFQKAESRSKDKKDRFVNLIREDITVLLAAVFFGAFLTGLGLSTAIFSQKLIDKIIPSGDTARLISSIVIVLLMLLAKAFLGYVRGIVLLQQGVNFNQRVIQRFYSGLLYLPKSFFDSRKVGELISRMNDTRRIQTTISLISGNIIIDALVVIISIAFVFNYSLTIGGILVCSLPLYSSMVWAVNQKIIDCQKMVMSKYSNVESYYVDTIQGIYDIKSNTKEKLFEIANTSTYGVFQNTLFKLGRLNNRFVFLSEAFGAIVIAAIFIVSSLLVMNKTIKIGELVAIISISGSIIPAINRVALSNVQLQEARVAFDRMYEFVSLPAEDKVENGLTPSFQDPFTINVENISFRFAGRRALFEMVSMQIKKGELTCLLGESGSGKSTLVQIIQKFYSYESGSIRFNDTPIDKIQTGYWRNSIGVVPQEVKIFSGNLLYNITLEDVSTADVEAVIKFCRDFGFHDYFETFPQGYMSILGEGGINLSGGQKQLVGMARALWNKPRILLLDEATSAMDHITEAFILRVLNALKPHVATLFVTHRIKVAKKCDRIFILQDGTISQTGTPQELCLSANLFSNSLKEEMDSV